MGKRLYITEAAKDFVVESTCWIRLIYYCKLFVMPLKLIEATVAPKQQQQIARFKAGKRNGFRAMYCTFSDFP